MKDITKKLLIEWKERKFPEIFDREIDLKKYVNSKTKEIIVVTGFRRVGKTYLLLHLAKNLLKENSRNHAIYFNFEDERIPLKTEFLSQLIPAIKQYSGEKIKVLLLDEIQNIPNWSKWLRRVYDTENIFIFVSGSSSKMSSREIPTELRGRFLEVKVFPLSFKEFLCFKKISFDIKTLSYSDNEKSKILRALEEYLFYGGLPEIVLSEQYKKQEIANFYYQTVVRRDIVERNKIRNEESLKALLRLLLNSTHYSITKLYNTLKSLNYTIGKTTLQQYLGYIENSYFILSVPIFSYKIKDQLQYPRKIYFIDNSFINLFSTKFSKDSGRLYENVVAINLKKCLDYNEDLFYWNSNGYEVDFVVKHGTKIKQLIQVCYDISDLKTKEREVRALIKASKELKCKNLLVITEDYEGEQDISWFGVKRKIKFIPLWKWLLQ